MRASRKFLTFLILILVVALSAGMLVACVPESKHENKNLAEKVPAGDVINLLMNAGNPDTDYYAFEFTSDITVSGDTKKVYFAGNMGGETAELAFKLNNADDSNIFAMYIDEGVFYLSIPGHVTYMLEDIDFEWIVNQFEGVGSIDNILSMIEISGLPVELQIDAIIQLVSALFMKTTVYEFEGDKLFAEVKFDIAAIVEIITGLGDSLPLPIDIAGLLGGVDFSGVDIRIGATLVGGEIVQGEYDAYPKYEGASLDGDVYINVTNQSSNVANVTLKTSYSNEPIGIIPEDIKNAKPFNLGRLAFDANIDLNANNFDVASFVNSIVGEEVLPENLIIINTKEDLMLKVRLDLKLKPESDGSDDSIGYIELYNKNDMSKVLLGIYLKDTNLYINAENLLLSEANAPVLTNFVVENVHVSSFLSAQIDSLKKTIEDLVADINGGTVTPKGSPESVVVGVSSESNHLSPTISSIITLASKLAGFENNIKVDGDSIVATIDKNFFDILNTKYGANIYVGDFGKADISINFAEKGLDSLGLSIVDNKNNNPINILLDNFTYGIINENYLDRINEMIESAEYITSVDNLLLEMLSEFSVSGKLLIDTNDTSIDIRNIVNSILILSGQRFNIPINLNIDKFVSSYTVNVMWSLDYKNYLNTDLLFEIKAYDNTLVGLYADDGVVYLDLAGVGLPKLSLRNTTLAYEFTALIENLIKGSASENVVAPVSYSDVSYSSYLAGDLDSANIDIDDIKKLLLQGVSIEDNMIKVMLTNTILKELFLGMNMNIQDDSMEAEVGIDLSTLNILANIKYDEISMALTLALNNLGNPQKVEFPNDFYKYDNLDGANSSIFIDSLFENLNPDWWIDLYTRNVDTGDGIKHSRFTFDKATYDGYRLEGHTEAKVNKDTLIIYFRKADAGNRIPLIIAIDPNVSTNNVRIMGTKELYDVKVPIIGTTLSDGEDIDQTITLDIKSMLNDLFGPIFSEIGTGNQKSYGVVADQKVNENEDIIGLIQSIDIAMRGFGDLSLDVKLDGAYLNEFVAQIFEGMGVVYDNKNPKVTMDSLYNNVLIPIIKGMPAGDLILSIGDSVIQGVLQEILPRFIPLPDFTQLNLKVNISGYKLDTLQLVGYDRKDSANPDLFDLTLFNGANNEDIRFVEFKDMNSLDNPIYQKRYIEMDIANMTGFENMFVSTAYKFNKEGKYYDSRQNVTWLVKSRDNEQINLPLREDMSAFKSGDSYVPGTYEVVGTAYDKSISVTVVITDKKTEYSDIESIEDVTVAIGASLPKYVNAKRADGSVEKVKVQKWIGAEPTSKEEHTVNAQVQLVEGGREYPVEITYASSIVSLYDENLSYETDIYSYKDFYNDVYTSSEILVKYSNGLLAFAPVEFSVKEGEKELFDELGNVKTPLDWADGFTTTLVATVYKGSAIEQTFEMDMQVNSGKVAYVMGTSKNNVTISKYDKAYTMPSELTFVTVDGKVHTEKVTWNTEGITFGTIGKYDNIGFTINADYNVTGAEYGCVTSVTIDDSYIVNAMVKGERVGEPISISYEDFTSGNISMVLTLSSGRVITLNNTDVTMIGNTIGEAGGLARVEIQIGDYSIFKSFQVAEKVVEA